MAGRKQGGPGKSYRKGITLIQAVETFGDEAQAEAWFIKQRWPDRMACPNCGSVNVSERPNRKPQPFHCKDCRQYFSVKTGTVMQGSNLSLSKWAIGFFLYSTNLKGVSSMKLHRDLGITQKSAWHMAHRIREAWTPETSKFTGPVEVHETYIGGKERNKHASKKLRAGRGTVGKTAVVGIRDRDTGQVRTQVVQSTDAGTLQGCVRQHTETDTMVYTDEASAYVGLPRPHEAVKHSVSEFVRGMASHERYGELLGRTEARLRRRLPPHEPQAPEPLHRRVRGAAQLPADGHRRPDERDRSTVARKAATICRSRWLTGIC